MACLPFREEAGLMLCTDLVDQAVDYFGMQNG
jgi:hypothetical protein